MTPDAAHHFVTLTYVALGVVFAVAAMRTFARARLARRADRADRTLSGELSEIKTRLAAVETMLREVG